MREHKICFLNKQKYERKFGLKRKKPLNKC